MMYRLDFIRKRYVLAAILTFVLSYVMAQDPRALDSLTRAVNNPKDNDQKIFSLIERAYLYPPRDLDKSLGDLRQAEKLSIADNNMDRLGSTYNAYGNLLSATSQYEEAIDYFRKALNVSRQISNQRFIAIAQANIGSNYAQLA